MRMNDAFDFRLSITNPNGVAYTLTINNHDVAR
jgi:hypothetical protein